MSSGPSVYSPLQSLNKAYRKQKPNKSDLLTFRDNLTILLESLSTKEYEDHHKANLTSFLKDSWYGRDYFINSKDRTDLVIHNDKTGQSPVAVMLEVKEASNKSEMVSKENLNAKALQELVLYYLRERVERENRDIKHLIITNVYEWFIFDSAVFYDCFYKNRKLVKAFHEWSRGQKESTSTTHFFSEIAKPAIEEVKDQLAFTHFNLTDYSAFLKSENNLTKLIPAFKILSPTHLLKLPFANDSNNLDKKFYNELLHIIGLEEIKEGSKKLIQRKSDPDSGSLLENTINILVAEDRLRKVPKLSSFGDTEAEQLFNVALELCITWTNRILFLKLLEGQLLKYHGDNQDYQFLDSKTIPDFDELNKLFFQVLAQKSDKRSEAIREKYQLVPYLNSSLFEINQLEDDTLRINSLEDGLKIKIHSGTVLKNDKDKRKEGELSTLQYLFEFLDAYDFSSEGSEEYQEENKTLINASVLGLIFEKINGYKDGSFFTPGFITMYMCRETIRRAIVQKFNEQKGLKCETFDELYNHIKDIKEANEIINSLKICDPAVGSGHFLVSALDEIIAIKSELGILTDRDGKVLREYSVEVVNDELIVSIDHETIFEYQPGNKESQRVQEALFHEKETIIENCLFGVDINPNSVKICRLRLWIELLKSAYYTKESNFKELETLPNIDINIKQGNSLISRFSLDEDLSKALKSIKYNIDQYRSFVNDYKNATDKEEKRGFETLINQIKADFRTEIAKYSDPDKVRLKKLEAQMFEKYQSGQLYDLKLNEKQKRDRSKLENQINKFSEKVKNKISDPIFQEAFEWRFEFPEVLDDDGNFVGFDIIIGNPPYIRQEELSKIKPYLSNHYSTFTGTADLYVYFVELGLSLLHVYGGFTFIIPNKWLRAGYGQKLRQFIKEYHILELLDFGDLPVFEEATTYPLIIELNKAEHVPEFSAVKMDTLEFEPDMKSFIESKKFKVSIQGLSDQGWTLTNSKVQELLNKLRSTGKPLEEYVNGKIYRGVLTGLNEAFVIDEQKKKELIEEDPKSDEIIKPFLVGRDIKRYQHPVSDKYLIFTRRGIDIDHYPSILKHLLQFKTRLEPKPKGHTGSWPGRKSGAYKWYEIQDAIDYFQEFENEKIIYPNICKQPEFTLDENKTYTNQKCFIITQFNKSFLGILNSKLSYFLFQSILPMLRGNFFEPSYKYFKDFPIVNERSEEIEIKVSEILELKRNNSLADISQLETEIDHLVYELYGLTEDEIKIVEGGENA